MPPPRSSDEPSDDIAADQAGGEAEVSERYGPSGARQDGSRPDVSGRVVCGTDDIFCGFGDREGERIVRPRPEDEIMQDPPELEP
jgi:hypothetical protein